MLSARENPENRTIYSDGTTPAVSYTYNTAGKLATAANGTDTLTWTYDLAGQLLSEQSTKNSSTVAYTYDLGGNRLTVSLDGTLFVSYAYDDASRLTTITRGSNVFGFGYDNANRRTSLSYPNGVNTSYSYDNLNRLLNLQANHVPTSTNITNFNYTYDAAGNRLTKQQPDYTEAYKYDPLYRLTQAERAGSLTGVQTWSYDAVGNRLTNQKDGAVTTSSYNEKNQLTSTAGGGTMLWRGSLDEPGTVNFTSALVNGKPARMLPGNVFEALLPMQAGSNTVTLEARDTTGNVATKSYSVSVSGDSATYTYDANGNLNQKVEGADTWVYEWTAENELKRVLKNGVEQASFKYDPKGRRVEKVAGGVTKAYAYSDQRVFRETGGATAFYVQGPGIDEPLAREESGVLAYRQADALWSIVATTNAAGSLTATTRYDAWGSIESGTPGAEAFTGREWDPETQLYFYRARHLDTRAGRFLSEDPLGFRSGVNFYSYVHNNPVLLNDPLGLQECCDCPSQSWYVDGGLTFSLSLGLGFSAGFGNMICVERPWVKRPIVIRCTSLGIQFGAGVAGDVQLPGNPSVTGVCRLNPMGPPLSSTGWTAGAGPVTASTDTDWRTTNVSLGISVSAGVAHQSCFIYPR